MPTHYENQLLTKIHDGVFGCAFVFPREYVGHKPGLRLSPLAVVVNPYKVRIIHDLTLIHTMSEPRVNMDTDLDLVPRGNLGHVLRDTVWRILYLRKGFGDTLRKMLSKMDTKDEYRQVARNVTQSPVFGYLFRNLAIVDRRLQLGRLNSRGYWCLFSAALEHAQGQTSFEPAVATEQKRSATAHVMSEPSSDSERPVPLHPRFVTPPGTGGGRHKFFVRYYVDDGILVEFLW